MNIHSGSHCENIFVYQIQISEPEIIAVIIIID